MTYQSKDGQTKDGQDRWIQRWRDHNIGFDQDKPHTWLDKYFNRLELLPGARVFVPLCGKSIDMLWLLEQGYEVVGVELSPLACDAFFQVHGLAVHKTQKGKFTLYKGSNITLWCGDIFDLTASMIGVMDAIYDRAALIALPTSIRKCYVEHMIELAPLQARMLLITFIYDSDEMQGPPFPVFEAELQDLLGSNGRLEKIHQVQLTQIAPHLQAKGLKQASEEVYTWVKLC